MRDEETSAAEAEAPATAPTTTKAAKPRKAAAAKGNGHSNGKATAKAAAPDKPAKAAKAAKVAAPKAGKAKAAKAAPKAERHRDPAKLDAFGFRKESIKSRAAAMYAKGKGATLAEVKEAVGSVQFNLLTELTGKGFTIDQTEVKNEQGRMVTRYKLHPKVA